MTFYVQILNERHDRAAFESASPELNAYFKTQAGQDVKRKVAACYVAVSTTNAQVVGFYTIACASVVLSDLEAPMQKKLPRYPTVPTILLGRLAVDKTVTGQGYGAALLADALIRAYELSEQIGTYAVIVDALNASAKAFYQRHGFVELPDTPMRLVLPMATIKKIFNP